MRHNSTVNSPVSGGYGGSGLSPTSSGNKKLPKLRAYRFGFDGEGQILSSVGYAYAQSGISHCFVLLSFNYFIKFPFFIEFRHLYLPFLVMLI